MARRYVCFGCLRGEAVEVRFDRKNRPYTNCGWCGSRTFIHSPEGLRGLMLLEPSVAAMLRQIGAAGLADADEKIQGWLGQQAPTAAATAAAGAST